MTLDWAYTIEAMPRLLQGALITIKFAAVALCISIFIAIVLSMARGIGNRAIETLIRTYVSFIRGTPLLIQIFLVYYALPFNLGPVAAGIAALALNSGAIMTEIFRGGLSAIPKAQLDAARSLGLKNWVIWYKIVLPQVFILITPPIVNEFTLLVKATSLLAVITVVELFRTAQQIFNENFRAIEVLLGAAVIYFLINFTASKVAAALARRNTVKLA
jgi:His/Glu/Gln/Arg/opine family amino acid ABC transporter permease subunit